MVRDESSSSGGVGPVMGSSLLAAAQHHGNDRDDQFVQQPGVGELCCEHSPAHHPDVPARGLVPEVVDEFADGPAHKRHVGALRGGVFVVGEDPAGRVRVRPGAGFVLHQPGVGLAAHDDAADIGHERVVAVLAAVKAVKLEQPGQVVIVGGDEAVEGGSHKVLEARPWPQPSQPAGACPGCARTTVYW